MHLKSVPRITEAFQAINTTNDDKKPMRIMKLIKNLLTVALALSTLSAAAQVVKTDNGLRSVSNGVVTEVRFYSSQVARILKYNSSDAAATSDPKLVVTMSPQTVSVNFTNGSDVAKVSTSDITVSVNKTTGQVIFYDKDGKQMIAEKSGATVMTSRKDGTSASYELKQTFTLDSDESIYGLGQIQDGKLNQRGQNYWYMVQGNSTVWVPYVHSVKGYGLYWDNMSPTSFNDNSDGMTFDSSVGHAIDYYYLAGSASDGDQTVALMRGLTGQVPMIPLWAYGYFQSKERYESADETMGVVKKYRDLGVPLDCVVQDWQYWGGNNQWNAMDFLNTKFSNYQQMIDSIHDMHAKILISFWANFGRDTKQFAYYKQNNELFKCGDTIMTNTYPSNEGVGVYDTYSKDARDYYWSCLYSGLVSRGIDAYWMDSSEPDHYQGGDDREKTFDFVTGLNCTWRSVRNAYPLVHVSGVYDHHRAESACSAKRVMVLTRSGYAGLQRTGANTWSGDITASWETLAKQIPAALNYTMCGIPNWNSDIGGFFNGNYTGPGQASYNELYARWIQFGTFCPMMRSHGAGTDRAIYRFGESGTQYYDNIEKYINLRYAMLPYVYSTAWDIHKNGSSFMRALPLAYPSDNATHDVADEYLFGSSFLVAPVLTAGASSRSVYLPSGEKWIDFWNGSTSDGGQTVSRSVDLQTIPLYVKAGSIIPWGPKVQYSTQRSWDSLEVRVYPGADGTFTLYEDEFDNYNYEQGKYTEIPFSWNNATQELTIGARQGSYTGMISKRKFAIVLVDSNTGLGASQSKRISKIVDYDGTAITVKVNNDNVTVNKDDDSTAKSIDFRATKDMFPLDDATKMSFSYGVGNGTYDVATHKLTYNGIYQQWGWGYGSGKVTLSQPAEVDSIKYLIMKLKDVKDVLEFRLEYYDKDNVLHEKEENPDKGQNMIKVFKDASGVNYSFIKDNDSTSDYTLKVDLEALGVKRMTRAYFWNAWGSATNSMIISDAYLASVNAYSVDVMPGEYTAICIPRNMTALTDGTTFYDVAGVDSKENPSRLYLKEHDGALLPGVPYIMKSTSSKVYFTLGSDYSSTAVSASGLIGCYASSAAPVGTYLVNRGSLVLATGTSNVAAYSGYVNLSQVPVYAGGSDPYILFGSSTGISNITASSADHTDVYTLSGVKVRSQVSSKEAVGNLRRGIYIVNGQKRAVAH
jgi:alpha-D-xyloside xylohydrolase